MHMSETLFKIDFPIGYRNTIINLCTTICHTNNESETNVVRRINACKKEILLAFFLVYFTVVDIIFDTSFTILVMVPVDADFFLGVSYHFAY